MPSAGETGVAYDLIHSNYWLSGVVGRRLKALWGCPHVITFHTLGAAKTAARAGHTEQALRVMEEETRLVRHCDLVIAPTAAERGRLSSLGDGRQENVHVIPCGVDLNRFSPPTGGAAIPGGRRGGRRCCFLWGVSIQ